MATREAIAFSTSTSGFPPNRIAKTIAAAVTTKILVLTIRDDITALSFPITGCSGSSL